MSRNENIDLRARILLYGNQGINAQHLKEQLGRYLFQSSVDFKKIEEKHQSLWSLRELRLIVGRNLLRQIHTYLKETDYKGMIHNFYLYLFSVWYEESKLGERKGISVIPHVSFRDREDILMATLCRKILDLGVLDKNEVVKCFVHARSSMGGYVLSRDVLRWVGEIINSVNIPNKKSPSSIDWLACGNFYLFINFELLSKLEDEMDYTPGFPNYLSRLDQTTSGLRVQYTKVGDFDKNSGHFVWKTEEDPSIKKELGMVSSHILKLWTGRYYTSETDFHFWVTTPINCFNPFSFNLSKYKKELELWL